MPRPLPLLNVLALIVVSMEMPFAAHGQGSEVKIGVGANPDISVDCEDAVNSDHVRDVGQWDRFEGAIVNDRPYADPYKDVNLEVAYTRPDGSTVKFWGFYDGKSNDGPTWRFRFMPDRLGLWRYQADFSDDSPAISGSFQCVASKLPGMISGDESNPLWFGFKGGGHTLVRGLHVGDCFFASNLLAERRSEFLDWAQKQGYNTLSVASHFLNRHEEGRGLGWETPKLWPLDAAEYRRMEALLDELARRQITVYPFAGFFGQNSDYPRNHADQERYIRYTIARLGSYRNLFWNTAGPEPNVGKGWMPLDDVQRLGRLIAANDPFGHLLSVHNRTGDDPYRDSNWTTYGTLQGPKTMDRAVLSAGLLKNHHPRKPLLAQETLWSGNLNHVKKLAGQDYSDDDVRKNAFVINFSAAALIFADNAGNSSTGYSATLDPADVRQNRHDIVRRVWDFLETVPYYRMSPRQDLTDRGYCLAEVGQRYLVYLESAEAVNVKVAAGIYDVVWIDATNTAVRNSGGQSENGAGLKPHSAGDWVLSLTKRQ